MRRSLRKPRYRREAERVGRVRLRERLRSWFDRQSLFALAMFFFAFVFILFLYFSWLFRPGVSMTADAMRIINEWNGQRTSLDFYLTMMMLLFWLNRNWRGYRVQIPQGHFIKVRRYQR